LAFPYFTEYVVKLIFVRHLFTKYVVNLSYFFPLPFYILALKTFFTEKGVSNRYSIIFFTEYVYFFYWICMYLLPFL